MSTLQPGAILVRDLFTSYAVEGDVPGVCLLCDTETDRGWSTDGFTDTVAQRHMVERGTVFCHLCKGMLKWRHCRTRCWLATTTETRFHQSGERWFWETLAEPPEPPFAIYHTAGGKKQGWIGLMHHVSWSRDAYWLGTDQGTYHPLHVQTASVKRFAPKIEELLKRGLRRRAIADGSFGPNDWMRAVADGYDELLREVARYAGDPLWEVMAIVCPNGDRDGDADACEPESRVDQS